jgi:hypothetical protein
MVYSQSHKEAITKVEVLSLLVLADQPENGEEILGLQNVFAIPVREKN